MTRVITAIAAAAALAFAVWFYAIAPSAGPPEGFARANGRIEATRVDVAVKFGGRIAEVLAREGDFVEAGAVLARMDSTELEAQIRAAEAATRQARQELAQADAVIAQRGGELALAQTELERAETLRARGYGTVETLDLRQMQKTSALAARDSAIAQRAAAEAAIESAQAHVAALESQLAEHVLTAPRSGRVQYRLAEPGEVVAAGGKIVTLLDLGDVYMDVYLPTAQAGRLAFGGEARLILDAAPGLVIPATVSFVAADAQFTPKFVETESEREKLMFRVRLKIPVEILTRYRDLVKTGLPGVAVVRLTSDASWPEAYAVRLP